MWKIDLIGTPKAVMQELQKMHPINEQHQKIILFILSDLTRDRRINTHVKVKASGTPYSMYNSDDSSIKVLIKDLTVLK